VILARNALAEGGFDTLEILVDDAASRENLLKFAAYAHCAVEAVEAGEAGIRIRLVPSGETAVPAPALSPLPDPGPGRGITFLVAGDGIGRGDPDLGRLLLRGFLHALTEADVLPLRIVFMNSGVTLAAQGSESLGSLRRLQELGVEILACGTCLDFFHLMDALAVGRITNLFEIASLLAQGPVVTL
jgi:selenium metabolism protein YedF